MLQKIEELKILKNVYYKVVRYPYDTKRKVSSNRRKILKMGLEKIAKIQNISENESHKDKNLQTKSIDE